MVLLLTLTKLRLLFTIHVILLIHIHFMIIYNSKIKFTCIMTSKGIPQISFVSFSKVKNLAVIKFSFCCFQCFFLNCQDHLEFCSSTRALVLCKTKCCIHFFIQIEKLKKLKNAGLKAISLILTYYVTPIWWGIWIELS